MVEQTQTEKLKRKLRKILAKGHLESEGWQVDQILQACKEAGLKFVETVNPPSLQDPGADTYPIIREIKI